MHLGSLIARLEREENAATALEALGDIVLFTAVSEAGSRFDESPGAYVAGAVARFANTANDDAWLGLVAVIERSSDPGRSALRRMLEWALQVDKYPGSDADTSTRHDRK